jgi:thioredoxin-like negative regulator of GroEL
MMAATENIDAAYELAFQLRCEGRYGEAKAELLRVLQISPRHCNARWLLGLIQGFEGDFDGSLETLAKVSVDFPDNIQVRNDLAMTQMMLGYEDEAVANFRAILRVDPSHENAKKQLAYYQ